MPEGDTIARAAAALDCALAGTTVTAFDTGLAGLARVDDGAPIVGRTIEACTAHGKHLLLRFSGGLTLRTHMRMHGSWHLYRHGERWQRSARAMRIRLDTAQWVAVAFDVPIAEFVRDADLARHRPLTTARTRSRRSGLRSRRRRRARWPRPAIARLARRCSTSG